MSKKTRNVSGPRTTTKSKRWTQRAETIADAFPINEPAEGAAIRSTQAGLPSTVDERLPDTLTTTELRQMGAEADAFLLQLAEEPDATMALIRDTSPEEELA